MSLSGGTTSPPCQVPFAALGRQHEALRTELEAAFSRVLAADGFILGAEAEAFEHEFAHFCGVNHCVGVASGTAALTIALLAAGIRKGDEVIVPGHTFVASALGVIHAGATPVFCDVLDATGLINAESAAAVVTDRTAAVMAVHLHGQVCDMAALHDFAQRHGLLVVEDAAQAHGAQYRERRAGSLGHVAAFSFYPSKNLGALGDAGAICTDDDGIADRARALRNLGQRRRNHHELLGYNERIDGIQAACLRVKLPYLDEWNAIRRRHARRYADGLADAPVRLLGETADTPCVFHLFPVRSDDREALLVRLTAAGVDAGVHYPVSAHRHPAIVEAFETPAAGALPHAEAWAREELSLPMFAELRADEIDRVVEVLRAR